MQRKGQYLCSHLRKLKKLGNGWQLGPFEIQSRAAHQSCPSKNGQNNLEPLFAILSFEGMKNAEADTGEDEHNGA